MSSAAPPNVSLRRNRLYQGLRRASLLGSWLFIFAVPLWHLRALGATSGVSTSGVWFRLASWIFLANSRPLVEGAPWTVRILGIEFLDPLAGLGTIFAGALDSKVLLGLLPTGVLVALLGRFFCGWICPYRTVLAASNAARGLLSKLGFPPRDQPLPARLSMVVLAIVLLVAALAGSQIAPAFYPPAILGRSVLSAVILGSFTTGAIVVLAAFLFDTLFARAGFCRHVCPGGALMTLVGAGSPVRVTREAPKCTDCGICDKVCNLLQHPAKGEVGAGCERCGLCIGSCAPGALTFTLGKPSSKLAAPTNTERRLVLEAVPVVAVLAVWARWFGKPARLRPPRAAPGRNFAARCIRCQRCAEVCPPKAIRFDGQLDLRGTDLPFIEARLSACTLCMRCTEACPTGALVPTAFDLPALQPLVRMGRPILDKKKCLPWVGDGMCRLCYLACPYPDSAIELTGTTQAPVFSDSKCVGCGKCEEVCPERARAITIEPIEEPDA